MFLPGHAILQVIVMRVGESEVSNDIFARHIQ